MKRFALTPRGAGRALLVLALLGAALGFFFVRFSERGTVLNEPVAAAPSPRFAPEKTTGASGSRTHPGSGTAAVPEPESVSSHPSAATGLVAGWDEQISALLEADVETAEVARKLLALLPQLPEEGRIEAIQHISNLLDDEDYPALARWLIDPKTSGGVQDELMADLLDRPNSVKLPTLLQVARAPTHAKAGEARELLEFFLEEDYGNDWPRWEAEMNEWLKQNPD
jgi:hypothetical protein